MSQRQSCEWPAGCTAKGRLYEYTNVLGRRVRHRYCDRHARAMQDPEQQEKTLRRLGLAKQAIDETLAQVNRPALSPEQLVDHDVQKALGAHQERCPQCAEARQWIVDEELAGRIRTPDDVKRIGVEVLRRCCPIGIYLQERLGRLMAGLST